MSQPGRADSWDASGEQDSSPEELAESLRAKARAAATAALREGLREIDDRYGMHVADQVVGLIDIPEVFSGLVDEEKLAQGEQDADEDEDKPYKFTLGRIW